MKNVKRHYSIAEAAKKLQLGPARIYDRVKHGELSLIELRDGSKGLRKEEIEGWINELRELARARKRRSRARKGDVKGKESSSEK